MFVNFDVLFNEVMADAQMDDDGDEEEEDHAIGDDVKMEDGSEDVAKKANKKV